MADRIVTTDEGADWSLIDFAKQVFGAQNATDVGFDFVETRLVAAEALPPPAAQLAVAEQKEPATLKPTKSLQQSAGRCRRSRSRKRKECNYPRRGRKPHARKGGNPGPPPKWPT